MNNQAPSVRHVGRWLLVIIVAQMTVTQLWLSTDRTPPIWDEAWYLWQGAQQLDALHEGLPEWYQAWTTLDRIRP